MSACERSIQAVLQPMHRVQRRGFTLIELVVIMSLMAIIAVALVGPTMSYMGSIRSRSGATRIMADIRYVQRYAMSARARTWVLFSVGSNNYTLYYEDLNNPGKANRKLLAHPLTLATGAIQLGSGSDLGVSLSSVSINSTSEIEFDSLGKPYDGNATVISSNGTISLSNGVTLTLYPVSGFVEQSG